MQEKVFPQKKFYMYWTTKNTLKCYEKEEMTRIFRAGSIKKTRTKTPTTIKTIKNI